MSQMLDNSNPSVVIVDYKLGNLLNVARAAAKAGGRVVVSSQISDIKKADRLILPGVGAFGDGMKNLKELGLVESIREYAMTGRPLLGICLGAQLLLSQSEEFGLHQGLDIIKGRVVRLQHFPGKNRPKIPHIGWNSLRAANQSWEGTVLGDFREGVFMYFLHSYVMEPESKGDCLAVTPYEPNTFCSVIKNKNITGAQFHPERSGENGLAIYRRFIGNGSKTESVRDRSSVEFAQGG